MPRARISDSLELYYEIHGSGPPVIFINGLTTTLESWSYQIRQFRKRHTVVAYDCRGQGQSGKPGHDYSGAAHTADLKTLMDQIGIARAHVIGLSFGGYIALNLAATYPDRVGSIVVSDSASEAYPLVEKILTGWAEAQDIGGLDLRFDVSLPWLYSEAFIKNNPRKLRIFKEVFKKNDLDAIRSLTLDSLNHRITERLQEITAPTLLIAGKEDLLTPPRHVKRLKEKIPSAKLKIIEDCGHVPPIEKPLKFNRIVMSFLRKHNHLVSSGPSPDHCGPQSRGQCH